MKKIILLLLIIAYNIVHAQNSWVQKADFGGAGRIAAVGFSIGTKGYIGTGCDSINYLKDFWEYDPLIDTWTQKADFGGTGRMGAVGFSIGNKGYIGTGSDSIQTATDFWEFDPIGNIWTQKADFPGPERFLAVGFSIGTKGYITSGFGPGYLSDLWEYDPLIDYWTQKAYFGINIDGRYDGVGFSIGNKGYFGTGTDSYYHDCHKEFWEYDPSNDTWTQKADFAGGIRSDAAGFSIGSKGYIGTGIDFTTFSNNMSDFWEYIPASNIWRHRADIVPSGFACHSTIGFSIGSKGYIGTGSIVASTYSKVFYEYTPDTVNATCGASFLLYADTIPQTYIGINSVGGVAPVTYSWNWGDGNFSSGIAPSHTYSAAGTYNICLTITDALGCVDSFCYNSYLYKSSSNALPIAVTFSNASTGLTNLSKNNNSFTLIPNPATDKIQVIFNSDEKGPLNCEILNTLGKKVLEKTLASQNSKKEYSLDISSLAKGVYILRVSDGLTWKNRKIIIQ